jgi:folate-dependent phosphoribosylglycinamide formyltransferase PurN
MSSNPLRLIVLTQGGCEAAVERLLALECAEIRGIFVETQTVPRRSLREKIARSLRYDGYRATAAKFAGKLLGLSGAYDEGINALAESRDRLRDLAGERCIPIHFVPNYHSEHSIALMQAADADLGVVLGTNILKEAVFSIPRLGSINLHQGLAPLYRGGPSIFWELCNGEREVGLTIHFVASKVDTGDIVVQRTIPLEYDYSYDLDYEAFIEDYRRKLIVPCANLLAEAVRMIAEGTVLPRAQDASLGKRYRLPTKREKDEMRRRLRERRRRIEPSFRLTQKARGAD